MQGVRSLFPQALRAWLARAASTALVAMCLTLMASAPAAAATLERIKESGRIRFGYFADALPFSDRTQSGAPEGYAVTLCQKIAEQVKAQLALSELAVDWVPVTTDRLAEVRQGNIDLLCAPTAQTLGRRQEVAFSIPIFPGGVRAVMRNDAAAALREALAETPVTRPVWRGSPAVKLLQKKTFAVVAGTTSENWLAQGLDKLNIEAKTVTVPDYRAGLQQLLERKIDVFFGDRAVVLRAMTGEERKNLTVFDRLLTHEPYSFALARDDDDFRLLVDKALSQAYASPQFGDLYARWCGELDDGTRAFFVWTTVPQ